MSRQRSRFSNRAHRGSFDGGGDSSEDLGEPRKEKLADKFTFLTRALVKNNVVSQNLYMALITIDYFFMIYYNFRIFDYSTLYKAFSFIEDFLNVQRDQESGLTWSQVQALQQGSLALVNGTFPMSDLYGAQGAGSSGSNTFLTMNDINTIQARMMSKGSLQVYINCIICGVYTLFLLVFTNRLFKAASFDISHEQSYTLKGLTLFMVLSKTVLQIPIITSIMVIIRCLALGVVNNSLFYVGLISVTLLCLEYTFTVIYSYKFLNLEVPNDDIAWSHNQTSGLYFKLILKVALCSQELYRSSFGNLAVSIIVLTFILVLEGFILIYRMNTPNIFNSIIHDFTLLLESLVISITTIGMIALVTQRDILSTLAYLCIFIPVIIKIFYTADQSRKHFVLFKLKNEEQLSGNEYLIAITHLLKMIKRQSETDLAQLLSFTYYHKLYCYDTACICQFFTQYCQDPVKFKSKKQRTYRGYKDDGAKLVLQVEDGTEGDESNTLHSIRNNGVAGDDETSSLPQSTQLQKTAHIAATMIHTRKSQQQNKDGKKSTMDVSSLKKGYGGADVAPTPTSHHLGELLTQPAQFSDQNRLPTASLHQEPSNSIIDVSQVEFQSNSNNFMDPSDNEVTASDINVIGQNNGTGFSQAAEFKETGIKGLFTKNQVLKGRAFNGFDSNLDFKIKNEFKSPSQFKTVHDSRTYFFTRLLETMFKQLEPRTKGNTSFLLISIFFQLQYQHNVYLAALTLVKLAKALNQSTLQKMTFSVTEYYLLELIMNDFKQHTKDEIDYAAFIDSSQMQQKLDWLFEDSSLDIIQFWRLFKEEQANVQRAYHMAMVISKNIATIRDYTQQLEEKQLIKDYNKYYYYAMFYQNLLNDKQSYNQMINNLRNLIMIKNIQRKNSRFGGNTQDINDIGFAILSLEEQGMSERSIGKFIFCNKAACSILNISEEDILGQPATAIMPELIRQNHELFVRRFFGDGLNRIFGQVRNMYVRDFNGYIKPVQFFVNFFYDSKFSYSILMHLDPVKSMTYFGTSQQISMRHCLLFLCSEDNVVQNMSENVRKILGLSNKKIREEEEILGRPLKIEDVVQQFSRIEYSIGAAHANNKGHEIKFLTNQQVKVKNFRNVVAGRGTGQPQGLGQADNEGNYIPCSLTYEEVTYLKGYPGQFTERVYLLIPTAKVPELIDVTSMAPTSNSQQVNSAGTPMMNSDEMAGLDSQSKSTQEITDHLTPSYSSMSTSSSSSRASGISSTKNLLYMQKSPKILNLYLAIVFGVFVSFILITTVNFVVYMQKKNNVNLQIEFNQIVNQRNIYLTATILDLKQLQIISQLNATSKEAGSVLNQSEVFDQSEDGYAGRFGQYSEFAREHMAIMQTNHQQFKQMSQRYQSALSQNQDQDYFKNIPFGVVSDLGTKYYLNNTLDYGIQLLIADTAMIKPEFFLQEDIPMNLDNYLKKGISKGKQVSQLFKNLFFTYGNGLTSINGLTRRQHELILLNTQTTSDSSNLFINLISFISIGMITFIGVFTFPMLGKIEDRKISVLKFFNILNIEQIQSLIQKGEDYRAEFQTLQRSVNQGNNDARPFAEESDDESEGENDEEGKRIMLEYGGHFLGKAAVVIGSEKGGSPGSKKTNGKVGNINSMGLGSMSSNLDQQRLSSFEKKMSKSKLLAPQGMNTGIKDIFKKIKQNDDEQKMKKKQARMRESMGTAFNASFSAARAMVDQAHRVPSQPDEGKAPPKKKEPKQVKNNNGPQKNTGKGAPAKKDTFHDKIQEEESKVEESYDEEDNGEDEDEEGSEENQEEELEGKKPRHKKRSKKKHKSLSSQANDKKQSAGESFTSGNSRTEHINDQLEKVALREKIKLGVYVFVVLIFLNSCLIACFSIGQRTFKDDSRAVYALTTFYHRQSCLENLLTYSYEQFIQNGTVKINPEEPDAVQYYLDYCQQREKDYNDLRRSLPVFLSDVASTIEGMESNDLCKTIFLASDSAKILQCEKVYDEIMQRGLTQTLYTIFNYAQTIKVRFQNENRTQEFLNYFIFEDQKLRDLTDLVKSYIHDAFDFIQGIVTETTMAYFNSLGQYYMIVYCCYMGVSILMFAIFGLFVFKKLRQQIITSANILAIMPLEEIDPRDRQKIESFLNS